MESLELSYIAGVAVYGTNILKSDLLDSYKFKHRILL